MDSQRVTGAVRNSIVVGSRKLADVMTLAKRVAPSSCTILITGESGTGKELVAHTVHDNSLNHSAVFVPLNVAAIPESLLESYLFGHERGAFTGAEKAREGVFRAAQGGTLFLDEIAELPINVQPKLLRALEQKEVLPVGSDVPLTVDTRIIAATDQDLKQMVQDGSFREDLFYRLNVINIHIPPLRERPEEIPLLVDYYLIRCCRDLGRPPIEIENDALRCLVTHQWKGNVRQLAHVVERSVLLCDSNTLRACDLPDEICDHVDLAPHDLQEAVESFKKRHIVSVLESVECHRERAAKALGISSATLYRYLDAFGLQGYNCATRCAQSPLSNL